MLKRRKNQGEHPITIPKDKVPRHVAIIMDGNGRWAQQRLLPRSLGHREGMLALKEVVKASSEMGIEVLTVYAFSTENWARPEEEVGFLMNLLIEFIDRELNELFENRVRVNFIGERERIPEACINAIDRARSRTAENTGLIFNVALNYGGRQEIVRSMQAMAREVQAGRLQPDDIDEKLVDQHLYTAGLPDPDLLIRTAGEMRISNYLLWQIAYTEFLVVDKLWPDFTRHDLARAVQAYTRRDRRFGGIKP